MANLSSQDANLVRELVKRKAAIVLDESKTYLIETRLEQAARDAGLDGPSTLIERLRNGAPGAERLIVEALTTHETSFFRDLHPFETLRRELLPALIKARETTRQLTIWSAACSTGQEPYSLAMMVLEHFPQLATQWTLRIVATDLSEAVLDRARSGRFRQIEVNRGLPAPMLLKYFEKEPRGTDWILRENVRRLVEFRSLNLLAAWTLHPPPDLVFMRNVLIYFDLATKQQLLRRLRAVLPADGALFLGSAETTIGIDDAWDRLGGGNGSYYRPKR